MSQGGSVRLIQCALGLVLVSTAFASEPTTIALPSALHITEDGLVVVAAGDTTVAIPRRPTHALRHLWFRNGERFLDRPGAPAMGPIDSYAGVAGPVRVTYRLEIRQVPVGPAVEKDRGAPAASTFLVVTREYRVDRAGAVEPGDPLPGSALVRLGTVRLRHSAHVSGIAFSRDGGRIVSASHASDAVTRVWDAATGRPVIGLKSDWTHAPESNVARYSADSSVACVVAVLCVSPDGTEVAAAMELGAVLWNAKTGQTTGVFAVDSSRLLTYRVAGRHSPDGRFLAVVGYALKTAFGAGEKSSIERRLLLLDREGRLVRDFASDPLVDAAFSPDSMNLAGASHERVRVWDIATGKVRFDGPAATRISFTGDGARLILASDTGLRAIDAKTGEELVRQDVAHVEALAVDRKGRVATGGWRTIRLHDPASLAVTREFDAGHDRVTALAFSPDGRRLASNAGHAIRLWDVAWARPWNPDAGHEGEVVDARFSPDGSLVGTASRDGTVRLWDAASGECRRILRAHAHPGLTSLAFSPDGARLLSSGSGGLRWWEPATGRALGGEGPPILGPEVVAWHPDGKTIAIGARDGSVVLAAPGSRKAIRRWEAPGGVKGIVRSIAFSADGSRLAACGSGGGLALVLDPTSDDLPRVVGAGRRAGRSVALAPDGRRLIAAGEHAVVVDLATGGETTIVGKRESWSASWSPDGKMIALGGDDGTVRFLSATSWTDVSTRPGHQGPVLVVAFSADGRRLVSAGVDTTALVWTVPGR